MHNINESNSSNFDKKKRVKRCNKEKKKKIFFFFIFFFLGRKNCHVRIVRFLTYFLVIGNIKTTCFYVVTLQ
jgi:hypothetical protein